jgi:hypothetical protein
VAVYNKWDNAGDCQQLGSTLSGKDVGHDFGLSLALSSDGTILAAGAPFMDFSNQFGSGKGLVSVFSFDGNEWMPMGTDLEGDRLFDLFSLSVDLSSDGLTLAVGGLLSNDGSASLPVYVRTYPCNGVGWVMFGTTISTEERGDQFGWSVSLNKDGSLLAVGVSEGINNTGNMRVFQYNGGDWAQMHNVIPGKATNDRLGIRNALSGDGRTLVVGAYLNDDGFGTNSGQVRVFGYDVTNEWLSFLQEFNGANSADYFGW